MKWSCVVTLDTEAALKWWMHMADVRVRAHGSHDNHHKGQGTSIKELAPVQQTLDWDVTNGSSCQRRGPEAQLHRRRAVPLQLR